VILLSCAILTIPVGGHWPGLRVVIVGSVTGVSVVGPPVLLVVVAAVVVGSGFSGGRVPPTHSGTSPGKSHAEMSGLQ